MRPWRVPALVLAAALSMVACTSTGPPTVQPTPTTPSRTATVPTAPNSASAEDAAIAEAKAALLQYERTVDAVFQAGGDDPEMRLADVATGEQLRTLRDNAAELKKNRWRQVGSTKVKRLRVTSAQISGSQPQVKLRFCLDASETAGVDAQGKSIRKPGAYAYFDEIATLVKHPDKGWLVSEESDRAVKSC